MAFKRAAVKPFYLRLALTGPAGAGKTWTALEVATFFAKQYGDLPPAYIDTERGSASKYASRFAFDVVDMVPPFHPDRFVKGIQMAVDGGYKVLVVDSLSHAWNGPGGLLELVDHFAKKYGGNSYAGWKDATPIQTRLLDSLTGADLHIIACMRAKMDYAQDKDERGRTTITKVGLAPVQRDGMEYEFDIVGDMTVSHAMSITKTRCAELTDQLFIKPGEPFARTIWNWTQSGVTREEFADGADTGRKPTYTAPVAPIMPKVAAPEPELFTAQTPAPSPAPAIVDTADGTKHVIIEGREQFEDFLQSDVLRDAAPAPAPAVPMSKVVTRPAQPALPTTPEPKPKNNGNGAKQASLAADVAAVFPGMCANMVVDVPYYQSANGGADMFRILRAAAAEGYTVITAENITEVISRITARGLRNAEEQAAKQARKEAVA